MQAEGIIRVNWLDWTSLALVIVGALNWGLVGLGLFVTGDVMAWNLVNIIFGSVAWLEALIYLLVGLAGIYELYFAWKLYAEASEEVTEARTAD
jgi:uncharacterized membrane protein YuzA (DUF378 family)